MRGFLYILTVLGLIGLASWAYHETHRTQASMAEMRQLQREIGQLREALSVQRAEWAWLNRPDRLRMLAEANFDRLRLMPMRPDQFGEIEQVAFPAPPPVLMPLPGEWIEDGDWQPPALSGQPDEEEPL